MASKLRYFVRLNAELKPVIGSNITRAKKPRTGKWLEIFPENCCNSTVCTTPTATTGDTLQITLVCGSTSLIDATIAAEITDSGDIVDALNSAFPFLGTFSVDGTDVCVAVGSTVGAALCEWDTLVMLITVS